MYNVMDFGANNSGDILTSSAIQKAIDTAASNGGGTVYIPSGKYLCGTIALRDNITLFLEPGSEILGSGDLNDYIKTDETPEGDRLPWHLIQAFGVKNVSITGQGTINGQGHNYWDDGTYVVDGVKKHRGYYKHRERGMEQARPEAMVLFYDCVNVRVDGINILDSAGWNMHLFRCTDVKVNNINIHADRLGPNTDGIDINGCKDVIISNSNINVGDDAIALKTTKEAGSCERINVSNCILSSRTCGVKYGTESMHPLKQIVITGCTIYNSERAFGIYAYEGGPVEDILVSNLVIKTNSTSPNKHERPIHIVSRKHSGKKVDTFSKIKNISFSNLIIETEGRIILAADKSTPIEDVTFSNITYNIKSKQDIEAFENPSPSLDQFASNLPHVRMQKAYFVLHGIDDIIIKDIQYRSNNIDLSDMNTIYAENVNNESFSNINYGIGCNINTAIKKN